MAEPVIVGFIIVASIHYHDATPFLMAYAVITTYILINVWSSTHLTIGKRLQLTFASSIMYIMLYVLSIVEYVALLQVIRQLHKLPKSISGERTTWISPERSGAAAE